MPLILDDKIINDISMVLIRCLGCDGDLYCSACYKEFHVGEDPNEHRVEKFKR